MLIATTSLAEAAVAYGVKTKKSYLPHSYLQNVDSLEELLCRILEPTLWEKLEPHMEWFHHVKMKDQQYRKKGRTLEQWRSEQEMWKNFKPKEVCNFREMSKEYLTNDVMCLYEIVSKMGQHMCNTYDVDIRQQKRRG